MKILYTFAIALGIIQSASAQNGLERIIVEKYYVSDDNDKTVDGDGGELPINSVTYRVYADMLPGYIFQAAFGTPDHEMRIGTTTRFFNNEDRGARHPTYSRSQAQNNTVMLDSWLSVGAGMKDNFGVLKIMDDGMNNIVNADGVLQNANPEAGIPLTIQDGILAGTPQSVTVVGFSDTDLSIFDDANDAPMPTVMRTRDGAWSSLNGSSGPDPDENIVLLGQFTTDGVFDFELNIQIRRQSDLQVEKYVARNPTGNEILLADLLHVDSLGITSTHDLINAGDHIQVFPNPSANWITVALDDIIPVSSRPVVVTVKSMDGSTVYTGQFTGRTMRINLDALQAGLYILCIDVDQQYRYVDKIVRIP